MPLAVLSTDWAAGRALNAAALGDHSNDAPSNRRLIPKIKGYIDSLELFMRLSLKKI